MVAATCVFIPLICVDDEVTNTHTLSHRNISSSEWQSNALNTETLNDDAGFVNYNLTGCLQKSDALSSLTHTFTLRRLSGCLYWITPS